MAQPASLMDMLDYLRPQRPQPPDPFGPFNSRVTYYAPGPGDRMEGGFETSQPNPHTGKRVPATLDDVRLGTSPFVTLAGDPSRYGQTVKMGPLTYTSPIDQKSYTVPDVTGYVHDTGSAFKGRPDKLDVAAGDYRGWSPQAASAAVTADAGTRRVTPLEGDEADRAMRPIGLPEPWRATGAGESPTETAIASGPPQGRKMAQPASLLDMFQPQDATGQPTDFAGALRGNANAMVGLGMGLLQPYRPGESPYAAALQGFQAGSVADANRGYRQAQLQHQKSQEGRQSREDLYKREQDKLIRDFQERKFAEEQRQFNVGNKGIPAGFARTPEGGLAPIPGGPADPKYLQQTTEAKAKPREMSITDISKLSEEGGKYAQVGGFTDSFEPRFAGYKSSTVGDIANLAGRNLPAGVVGKDVAEGATWWQGYDRYKNVIRNDLYGSALTPSEQAAFEKADITPGMDPKQIEKNLATQKTVVQNGLKRKANAMIAAGYDPKVIAQSYGVDLKELGVTATGRRDPGSPADPAAPAATNTPVTGNPLDEARHAIRMGAPRAKVIERLAKQGIRFNPKDLD